MKIGIISGLIAGIITGLLVSFIGVPILGLHYNPFALPSPPVIPFTKTAANEMINNLIWGTILGAIYSRVYRVIPGKAISKGLLFGLFGYLIYNIYFATIFLPFLFFDSVTTHVVYGLFIWIPYGLVLGTLFEFLRNRYYLPKKEPRIIEYDMKGGILPGAIAGFLGGLGTFFTIFISVYTGIWEIFPRHLIDIGFIISLFGTQIMIHLIPGTYLGAIYPKVYNLVPSKGIVKGLIYGLIATFLINELRLSAMHVGIGYFNTALANFVTGSVAAIVFGLVIGVLYKK